MEDKPQGEIFSCRVWNENGFVVVAKKDMLSFLCTLNIG